MRMNRMMIAGLAVMLAASGALAQGRGGRVSNNSADTLAGTAAADQQRRFLRRKKKFGDKAQRENRWPADQLHCDRGNVCY